MITLQTKCGQINGIEKENCNAFLGVPYATAARFQYAKPITQWNSPLDATKNGPACPQFRAYYPHFENPKRKFFHKEFRQGLEFAYDENCLNLNIFTPKQITNSISTEDKSAQSKYPVIIYIHGGGFDSGCNCENPFDGEAFAKLGIITVFINYRVGVLGYFCNPEIQNQFGRNGNFGLDDQLTAIKWIKNNIEAFGGDSKNITIMGQSAGAISIQYLCCNPDNSGLFKNAVMMSGGGKFPEFSLPRQPEKTYEYWDSFMKAAGVSDFHELKNLPVEKFFDTLEKFRPTRKDNTYNTMPVVDGVLIPDSISTLIKNPLKVNYMLGYTNCDMYAPLMGIINHKYAKQTNAYLYYFDVDAKGDNSKAFHSSDLHFMFHTLEKSWRPYTEQDYKISELMEKYVANFARTGNPNDYQNPLPKWKNNGQALHFCPNSKIKMTRCHFFKLLHNMITGGKQI